MMAGLPKIKIPLILPARFLNSVGVFFPCTSPSAIYGRLESIRSAFSNERVLNAILLHIFTREFEKILYASAHRSQVLASRTNARGGPEAREY